MKAVLLVVFSLVSVTGCFGQMVSGMSGTVTTSTTLNSSKRCDSHISMSDGWKTMASAPRDGTVVELAETYGVAPWYGIYKFKDKGWQKTSDPNSGVSEDNCLFWRPYKGDASKYKDPTGGKQQSVKYWCDAMHIKYDPKKDVCVP